MSTFTALAEVIEAKGLICALYADRPSHYWHTPVAGGKVDKDNPILRRAVRSCVAYSDDRDLPVGQETLQTPSAIHFRIGSWRDFWRQLRQRRLSPKDSRKRHRRAPFCVMIQLLKLDQTREFGGDGSYPFEDRISTVL